MTAGKVMCYRRILRTLLYLYKYPEFLIQEQEENCKLKGSLHHLHPKPHLFKTAILQFQISCGTRIQ
jgi:hypothetical protein